MCVCVSVCEYEIKTKLHIYLANCVNFNRLSLALYNQFLWRFFFCSLCCCRNEKKVKSSEEHNLNNSNHNKQ